MVEKKKIKKVKKEKSMEGVSYNFQIRLARAKQDYIANLINGRYFLERCNMIAEQIQSGDIKENIDGCPKPEPYMRAEYAFQKKAAINCMRDAHFGKVDLMDGEFKLTKEDLFALEEDYYDGKIIREEYDESFKQNGKAQFVDPSKD